MVSKRPTSDEILKDAAADGAALDHLVALGLVDAVEVNGQPAYRMSEAFVFALARLQARSHVSVRAAIAPVQRARFLPDRSTPGYSFCEQARKSATQPTSSTAGAGLPALSDSQDRSMAQARVIEAERPQRDIR